MAFRWWDFCLYHVIFVLACFCFCFCSFFLPFYSGLVQVFTTRMVMSRIDGFDATSGFNGVCEGSSVGRRLIALSNFFLCFEKGGWVTF